MSEAALVSSAAGDLYIINRPAGMAWQVGGYFYPGAALNSLLQAAAEKAPNGVGHREPAPEALELPAAQLQTVAELRKNQYTVNLAAVTRQTCTFLGAPLPEPPDPASPEANQPEQAVLAPANG